jgi:MATE family multidrug resistance protein
LGISNILFIGHIGADELAASALGVMFCNVTGYSVGIGLLAAMDTLGAQAFGAKNYMRVGILLQRTIFILAIACIPISILWACSEQVNKTRSHRLCNSEYA